MVDPKNLNPLFFMSLLIASDSGEVEESRLKNGMCLFLAVYLGKKTKHN